MAKWLPAADCILEMMIRHLPSPVEAQKYRTEYLYEGDIHDECAKSMIRCDPKGPVVIYISKMVPDGNRFYAFGRIFSGTITPGQKVKILGPNFKPGSKDDYSEKSVQRVFVPMGKRFESLSAISAGNTVGLSGIDDFLVKTGTLIGAEINDPYPIRSMKYSVSPVFRVAVRPKNPADLPKVMDAIGKLAKTDPLVQCTVEDTGEIVIAGCGELHMEVCLRDLREFAKCEIVEK
jgi:elongation factor 2